MQVHLYVADEEAGKATGQFAENCSMSRRKTHSREAYLGRVLVHAADEDEGEVDQAGGDPRDDECGKEERGKTWG